MPIEYQYSAAPQPLKPTKKYRSDEEAAVTLNYLADPRVIKGNTHALARQLALNKSLLHGTNGAAKTSASAANSATGAANKPPEIPSMPSYNYTVHRYVSADTDLNLYLTEQEAEPKVEYNVESQTDRFQPRPPTPDFIPRKTGIDTSTQVDDVNELFNFDEEVRPLVTVIVAKTIEQAMFEVKAEMELLALEEDAAQFMRQKKIEDDWTQKKLDETKEEAVNKAKAIKLQTEEMQKQTRLKTLVAGLQCMHQVLPSAFDAVCEENFASGKWIKENEQDVVENFCQPLYRTGTDRTDMWLAARALADELMEVAQQKYSDWKPARRPPARSCQLTVTVRAANLTVATAEGEGEGGGGREGEEGENLAPAPEAKDLVVRLIIGEEDSVVDVNRRLAEALRAANATATVPTSIAPYLASLLGPILPDIPIMNFPLPASLQIVF